MNIQQYKGKALYNLVIASLLSEGDRINIINHSSKELHVPFNKDKSYYLYNYLSNNDLLQEVIVEPRRNQFKIILSEKLGSLINHWYAEGEKIFEVSFGYKYLNYNLLVLFINLFGIRKIEGISISTTIGNQYLRTLSYCMEKVLNINITAGNNQIKVPEVPRYFLETAYKVSTLDSSEIANFLTNKEKKKLMELILENGEKYYA